MRNWLAKDGYKFIPICVLLLVAIFYVVFLTAKEVSILEQDGKAIVGDVILDTFLSGNEKETVQLASFSAYDSLYENRGRLYLSNNQEISATYPLYVNDNLSIVNISSDSKLITTTYQEEGGYPYFTLSNGTLYNYGDGEQASYETYLFLKLSNGLFVNSIPITIETANEAVEIPMNSILYIEEDQIQYYSPENDTFTYHQIEALDDTSKVKYKETEITYQELLDNLKITSLEEGTPTPLPTETPTPTPIETPDEEPEEEVEKPVVQLTDVTAGVYGLNGTLSVTGDASKITQAITFTVRRNGNIVLRKQYISFGNIRMNGLEPDATYEITGTYTYQMSENEEEITETFYQDTITMNDISSLGPIVVSFESGSIFSNKIQLNNLKITEESDQEALYGLSRAIVEINGEQYNVGTQIFTSLSNKNPVTYESPELLDSNQTIDFTIIMRDSYGNNLPMSNNTGSTRTAKKVPIVTITTIKNEVNDLQIKINLDNDDNVVIENYRYVIYTSTGEIFLQDSVPADGILKLTNLNSEDWYQIFVYGSYDIEDGNGKIENHTFANMRLTAVPLTTLGLAHINVTSEVGTENATLSLTLDSATDNRLLPFIKDMTVKLINGEEEHEHVLTEEELQAFIGKQTLSISFDRLISQTEYQIDIKTTIGSLDQEEVFDAIFNLKSIKTLKYDAKIYFRNRFTMQTMIDFDVRIDDPDSAIESGRILLEVRNQDDKLIDVIYLEPNQDFEQITLDNLTPQETYRLTYIVEAYNTGYDNSTHQENYILYDEEIKADGGITGEIQLHSLLEKSKTKNLFDINEHFYADDTSTNYSYIKDDNSITFTMKGTNTGHFNTARSITPIYVQPNTTYVISFRITSDTGTVGTYGPEIFDSTMAKNGGTWADYYISSQEISTPEQDVYAYKFTTKETTTQIAITQYIGNITGATHTPGNTFTYSDFMLTEGESYVPYEPYEKADGYEATLRTTVNDSRAEITNQDYYVELYKGNELLDTFHGYLDENHQVNQVENKLQTEERATYIAKLKIKVRDRFYELDSIEFTADQEIRSIYTLEDYIAMESTGKYLVQNDLDFTSTTNKRYYNFSGFIDFQGHKVITDNDDGLCRIMDRLEQGGTIQNVVVDAYMNKTSSPVEDSCFVVNNQGTIKNIQMNLKESTQVSNNNFGLITDLNYGTIENFVVHLEESLYGSYRIGAVTHSNNDTIRNGYVYGEAIDTSKWNAAESVSLTMIGGIAGRNDTGIIENVYILSKVNAYPYQSNIYNEIANISGNNSGTIRNVYSVGSGDNRNTSYDINGRNPSRILENSYYVADQVFNNSQTSTKVSALTLQDNEFQQQVINSQDMFEIDSLLELGYYPQVKMDDCMPAQEYIPLPEVENENLADIISTTVVERTDDSAILDVKIYNPNQETVESIDIQYLTTEILSQETSNQETIVRLRLINPQMYISSYSIRKMTMVNQFNIAYDREYISGEKQLDVSFYRAINSEQDWQLLNTYPRENFKLKRDLDFTGIPQSQIYISQIYGILDGENHSVSNISSGKRIIGRIETGGLIQNIQFNNITLQSVQNSGGVTVGIIQSTYGNIINVSVNNAKVIVDNINDKYIGILVGQSTYANITNSSINNSQIVINASLSSTDIGGITGYIADGNINNSYIYNLEIQANNLLVSCNIGGIVGNIHYTRMRNTYATGSINVNMGNVGGLVGFLSGYPGIVESSYSLVNITGSATSIGGISGSSEASGATFISNVLSLGSLYTSATTDSIDRIGFANNKNNLYAWNKMTVNGFTNAPTNTEILKTTQQLLSSDFYQYDIGFDNSWDLSGLSKGILPKLYSTTGELLPNQPDIYLEEPLISIDDVVIDKRMNDATILLELSHSSNIEITDIIFEYLNVDSINRIVPQGNTTTIELTVSPDRAYDGYRLSQIKYLENGVEHTFDINAKIDLQFFKDINSIEDWQAINPTSNENYRLNTDLDFSSIQDINHNLIINRMEGTSEGHKISNITIQNEEYWHLFENINASLKNITFENIIVEDTGDLNNQNTYDGVGKYTIGYLVNNADIENIIFNNIKLSARSNGMAILSQVSQSNIKNIELNSIEVNGASYTGGFIAQVTTTNIDSVLGNNLNVTSVQGAYYTGGVLGYYAYEIVPRVTNVELNHITVSGTNKVGGFAGVGSADNLTIDDVTVTGTTEVAGIAAHVTTSSVKNNIVKNSHITGFSSSVAGLYVNGYDFENLAIVDSVVESPTANSTFVGGVFGYNYRRAANIMVVRTNVRSLGDYVGGIIGSADTVHDGYYSGKTQNNSAVIDSTVTGDNYVGGIAGYNNDGSANNSYVARTTIQGSGSYVGGFYGYSKNDAVTSSAGYTRIQHSMIQNSNVIGNDNVGGIIGYVTNELNSPDFDDIYLDVNVQTSNVYGTANIGIGNHNNYISMINNLHVYANSTVNTQAVKDMPNANLSAAQLWSAEDFHNPSKYILSNQWRLSDISNGYYPKLYIQNTTTLLNYQEDISLPTDTNGIALFRLMSTYLFEEFPTYEVYTSGIDTVNIEFDEVSSNAYLRIETNDSVGNWIPITNRVYTLGYDFNTDFKVTLTDGRQTFSKEFKSDDLRFPASVYDDSYYYIEDGTLKGNQDTNLTDVIHVYRNYALKSNGEVYNLSLNQYDHNVQNNLVVLDQVKPLYESLQDNGYIRTYANFTTVTNNNTEKVLDYQVISSNNTTSIVNEGLSNRKNMNIMDSYGNNEYHTILGTDGMLHDLKENIKVPNDFKNSKIKFMTDNIGHNNGFVIIQYEDGKLYGFNYRTGQKLFVTNTNTNQSVTDYLMDYFTSSKSVTNDTYQEYQESIKLKDQIYKSEKQDSEENTLSKDNYVTSYNPITNDYEIYKQNTVLDVDVEEDISETQKMYQDMNLYHTYISSSKASNKWFRANERTLIIAICIAMILVAIAIGYRNIYKKNKKAGE